MTADRERDPGASSEPVPAGSSRRDGESADAAEAALDRLLDEACRAERDAPPADAGRFLARLSHRLAAPSRPRVRLAPALSLAAMVPIALAIWWFIAGSPPAVDPGTTGGDSAPAAETALLEELDILELLAELAPATGETIDPDLIDLYVDFEIIDELPVETLGKLGMRGARTLRLAAIIALLALSAGSALPLSAQEPGRAPSREPGTLTREERIERNRERWRELSPERREQIRRVHEALRRLSPEERVALEERLRRLGPDRAERLARHRRAFDGRGAPEREELRSRHRAFSRWRASLSPEERERLAALPPEELRAEMRRRMESRLEEHRSRLSPEDRARFDLLERPQKFAELRRAHGEEMRRRHRERLAEEDRARFDALSPREQMREAFDALPRPEGPDRRGLRRPGSPPHGGPPGDPAEGPPPPGKRRPRPSGPPPGP